MASRFNIYCTDHLHSRVVSSALSLGTQFPVVRPAPLLDGGVAMYGFLRGLLPTLNQAREFGRPWVYADRGYFRATYGADHSGHFRFTRNAFQHDGRGQADPARFQRLVLRIAPWRRQGKHVLICPPGDVFTQAMLGISAQEWLEDVGAKLAASTDRPLRVRSKAAPSGRPLIEDLQDCHALVTFMSNTAVEAVLAGVPVFTTGRCAAAVMGCSDLAKIETPRYPEDRERWAAVLAANQWTLEEVRAGKVNRLFEELVHA